MKHMTIRIKMNPGKNNQWILNPEVEFQQKTEYSFNLKLSKSAEDKIVKQWKHLTAS